MFFPLRIISLFENSLLESSLCEKKPQMQLEF